MTIRMLVFLGLVLNGSYLFAKDNAETIDKEIKSGKYLYRLGLLSQMEDNGTHFIDVLRDGKSLHRVVCRSDMNASIPCYPVPLAEGGFILVDCFSHDSVLTACALEKYDAQAGLDKKFVTPFPNHYGPVPSEINSIESVEELPNKTGIKVTGTFQYEKIDGIPYCQRQWCDESVEEECVGFGGLESRAKLTFDLQGKVTNIQVIEKAEVSKGRQLKMKNTSMYNQCLKRGAPK